MDGDIQKAYDHTVHSLVIKRALKRCVPKILVAAKMREVRRQQTVIIQLKAPFGGSTAAPLFFLAVLVLARPWRCLVEVPSCFWRVSCVLLPTCLSTSRAVGMFWKFAEVGVMKSPPVFVERSREVHTLARTDCFLRSALETPEAGVVLVCCMLLCVLFWLRF